MLVTTLSSGTLLLNTPSTDDGGRTHNLDDISVLLSPLSYIGVLVAGEGLEPPSSAYETELETTSSLTRYIFYITTSATS